MIESLNPPAAAQAATGPPDRRLVAIVFVDIVGYTILMAEDEQGTHERWMRILSEVLYPETHRHRGRIIRKTGDGVLAEFPSALDAVEWGLEVQRLLRSERDTGTAGGRALALRISAHVGDVITEGDDIYGDGVNLTARLQEHADPGGIVVSEAVHDLVRGHLNRPMRDLGLLDLKNIELPVHAYAIDLGGPDVVDPVRPRATSLPSIAVLPLVNLSGDVEDHYFADGIVEDIIVSLANLRELMVIARPSSLTIGRQQTDPREVGKALGVRYVFTGSVRRSPQLVRVSVRLHDAHSGAGLWGGTMEAEPGGLFELQDRIVHRIVAGIAPHLRSAELRNSLRKRPDSFTAYDYTLRALDLIHSLEKPAFMKARDYLNRAMAEDENFAMPVAWAARWHSLWIGQGWSTDRKADSERAAGLAARAIELDRQNALALATYGHVRSFLFRDHDSGLIYFDRALEACPNSAIAWTLSSGTLSYIGRGEQAVRHADCAIQLSPFDQSLFHYYMFLSLAHYANGTYEEAQKWARMSLSENPLYTSTLRLLAASSAALDRVDEARAAARRMTMLDPAFRLGWYETVQPFRDPALKESFLGHLRKAGLTD